MNREVLLVVESVSNEKGVDKEVIFEAIEAALAMATKKKHHEIIDDAHGRREANAEFQVRIDRSSGTYETYRCWEVIDPEREVEEDETEPAWWRLAELVADPDSELTPDQAKEKDPTLKIGQFYQVPVESVEFGRIAAQTAKQVIVQKVREAERSQVIELYESRVGQLVSGTIKKTSRESVIVDLGNNAEAILTRENLIPRDTFRVGDRVRALLQEIRPEARGPQLILTRTTPKVLVELFKIEVPEIAEDVIEIRAAARDPGSRAKIAVKTNDGRIDAVGACVGMRGSRVQAVSGELAGEKIDVVLWDDDPAQLAISAMSPAEVKSIFKDDENHTMDIAVEEEKLAQAIGRGGQNVRLASELTGWNLQVMDESAAQRKQEEELLGYAREFMEALSVNEEIARLLVEEGFVDVEEVAYVQVDELTAIDGFDRELVDELRSRARDALLSRELAGGATGTPAQDLLGMDGMDQGLAFELAAAGVVSMDDLAELSVADLLEIKAEVGEARAAELIMTARAPWFEEDASGDAESGDAESPDVASPDVASPDAASPDVKGTGAADG